MEHRSTDVRRLSGKLRRKGRTKDAKECITDAKPKPARRGLGLERFRRRQHAPDAIQYLGDAGGNLKRAVRWDHATRSA